MKAKLACFLLLVTMAFGLATAQDRGLTVSGVVTDPQGEPVPGVVVQIQGTTQGVTADVSGHYSINVPAGTSTLIFTCMGYQTQDVPVAGRSVINVTMIEEASELEETVVVAYGQQRKESVVAAVSSIPATGLKQTPASNLGIALAGRLPGLTVLQRSGVPGGEQMNFYIRGASTVNGQSPLILVDGVERDFTALDPREVETITVLKDASATAVYGVRGANGVILVTTRRGKSGAPVIDVTMEQSFQNSSLSRSSGMYSNFLKSRAQYSGKFSLRWPVPP